jgi:uncharacterized protein with NRDE domain
VCLLIVLSRLDVASPLVVAANRDERLDRPAIAATVLVESGPRVLGGRDELAGGTWLAVNEHGLVAGLTNRPSPGGRDASKRSRGELPLALARHQDATSAVEDLAGRFRADDYNAAWLLVGDRRSLYYVQLGGAGPPTVEALPPGLYVLANDPLDGVSAKTSHVRARVDAIAGLPGGDGLALLRPVLADHTIPPAATPPVPVPPVPEPSESEPPTSEPATRPAELAAACVHTDGYGTRSAALVRVPAEGLPSLWVADGPPCRTPFVDVTALWREPAVGRTPE